MELKDYIWMLRRRLHWFLLVSGSVFIVYAVLAYRELPRFKASGQLKLAITESETRLAAFGPAYGIQLPFYTLPTRIEGLKSEDVLWAAAILTRAAGKSVLPTPIEWTKVGLEDAEMALAGDAFLAKSPEDREEEVKRLAAHLEVTGRGEGYQTVLLTFEAELQEEAQLTAGAIARAAELISIRDSTKPFVAIHKMLQEKRGNAQREIDAIRARLGHMAEDELVKLGKLRDKALADVGVHEQKLESLQAEGARLDREIQRLIKEAASTTNFFGVHKPVSRESLGLYLQWRQQSLDLDSLMRRRLQVVTREHPELKQFEADKAFREQELARSLDLQQNFDVATKLREEKEIAFERDAEEKHLGRSRDAFKAHEDEYSKKKKQWQPEWDKLHKAEREVDKLDDALREVENLSTLQREAKSVTVTKWPGKPEPVPSGRRQSAGMWAAVALLLGFAAAYFFEYIDTNISTDYDIRRHLNIPVIGIVPEILGGEETILSRVPAKSPLSEIFHASATILRASMLEAGMKTLVITSANPREGKTTVGVNLAVALARKGLRTVIVDTDLRIPQIHAWLGVPNNVGVTSLVEGRLQAMEALAQVTGSDKPAEYLQTTEIHNLFVLPSGPVPTSPVHIIESKAMRNLVEEMRNFADVVIFDSPPVCTVGDALSLATIADGVLFVIGSGYCERRDVSWAKHLLTNIQARLLGAMLNRAHAKHGVEYYYYHGYYYDYSERGRSRKSVRKRR